MTDNFRDNEDRNRFELDVEGTIAFVTYRKSPGAITLVHTDVPPELGGRGIGSKLGRATLDAVRAQGRKLSVECDFIRSFMKKYPEYDDLLTAAKRRKEMPLLIRPAVFVAPSIWRLQASQSLSDTVIVATAKLGRPRRSMPSACGSQTA